MYSSMDEKSRRKNMFLTDKIARKAFCLGVLFYPIWNAKMPSELYLPMPLCECQLDTFWTKSSENVEKSEPIGTNGQDIVEPTVGTTGAITATTIPVTTDTTIGTTLEPEEPTGGKSSIPIGTNSQSQSWKLWVDFFTPIVLHQIFSNKFFPTIFFQPKFGSNF